MGKERSCAKKDDLKGCVIKSFIERLFLNEANQERRSDSNQRDAKRRKDKGCRNQDRSADILGINVFVGNRIQLDDQRDDNKCKDRKKRVEKRISIVGNAWEERIGTKTYSKNSNGAPVNKIQVTPQWCR
ncbi:MAG TPA: hypothetical protein VGD69_07700 [Herpetosiphonaceae bacterium]